MNVCFWILLGTHASMVDQVILKPCAEVDLSSVRTATECISAAGDPDIVACIEEAATHWCSKVEKVS